MKEATTLALALAAALGLAACDRAAAPQASAPATAAAAPAADTTPAAPATAPAAAPAARPALPAEACQRSEDGFGAFFERYVQDPAVRAGYTAAQLELRDLRDPAKPGRSVPREQADPFRIALVDSQWVYDEPGKDPGQLERIDSRRKLDGDRMRVDFVRAEFTPDDDVASTKGAPEAYVFTFEQGCWQLSQQLR
ncbi:hypothetical protein K4L06_18935 [Lysobacter sp. BMK333-48F3]|uniref:hypothetical protein n=1 Tax=Lysobacter sp. BMK333-48F3 TaxID=2867962 RepID=UPI001C8C45F4|nr:hypothetical protein [Lysobacter sp. BMK333-48F3]MBX9403394.1 hypothetical protein [Lysobacter sp. BMK333-48F3]